MTKKKEVAIKTADAFLKAYFTKGIYLKDAITLLCKIATDGNQQSKKIGSEIIFTVLTERLCDSFKEAHVFLYDRMFSQVIDFCRHLPAGRKIHSTLNTFKIKNEQDMLRRKQRIRLPKAFPDSERRKIKKIFILSRVTIGSDVVVTSVIIEKMKRIFRKVPIVFIASSKIEELFGGDNRIRICRIDYPRKGGIVERLNMWIEVFNIIKNQTKGLKDDEYLVVDPDSRLTQLGLFPVLKKEDRYYFFESRTYMKKGIESLSQLTAVWINNLFGRHKDRLYPYLCLVEKDKSIGKRICQALRRGGARHIVSMNFGIGGNADKRVSLGFEEELLYKLMSKKATIILDKGAWGDVERTNQLIENLRKNNKAVIEITKNNINYVLKMEKIRCDILVWEGRIGIFSSLIASSDVYIGYDSAFQHVASALLVPTIVIFAGASSDIFFKRWRSYGKGIIKIVRVLQSDKKFYKKVTERIYREYKQIQG